MIKINIKTNEVAREDIPGRLEGLDVETLQNLQTELNPVPVDLLDIEYWPEVDANPGYDPDTQRLGDEILTPDVESKTVNVGREVLGLTTEEINAKIEEIAARLAELERLAGIEAAQENAGLRQITVAQAETWVSNKMDSAGTVLEVKQAIKEILLKMVPYLLK